MRFEATINEIARMLGGVTVGNGDIKISSIARAEEYKEGCIVPLWEKKFISKIKSGTVLLTKSGWTPDGCSGIEVEDPRRALTLVLEYIERANKKTTNAGIHPSANVDSEATIGKNVYIGPACVISKGAKIGDNTILTGNVWVGGNVTIGSDCLFDPGVILYDGISIGNRCIIHANAIIGCDGFGFMPDPDVMIRRIPQVGTVVIEDDVEIGCQTCIDKATFGETKIGRGTKIDALVKIGHNTTIGKYSIIVAQVGIAGSSTIGNGVTMAAQSGIANHATIGDGCLVGGRSGIMSDIPAGSIVSGFPAREHKKDMRIMATTQHLPEMEKKLRELAKAVEKLTEEKA